MAGTLDRILKAFSSDIRHRIKFQIDSCDKMNTESYQPYDWSMREFSVVQLKSPKEKRER